MVPSTTESAYFTVNASPQPPLCHINSWKRNVQAEAVKAFATIDTKEKELFRSRRSAEKTTVMMSGEERVLDRQGEG